MAPNQRDISIPSTITSAPPNPYTIYNIRHRTPSAFRDTTIQKRYSDFVSLHNDLQSQTSSPPPAPLPSKSWFSRTVNNPTLTEERRQSLQRYLQAIESAEDAKWRNAPCYRSFLALDGPLARALAAEEESGEIRTSAAWLDAQNTLKEKLKEARSQIRQRDESSDPAASQKASSEAKRHLSEAGRLIVELERSVTRMSGKPGADDEWGAETIGGGEANRRRGLITSAKKEKDALEALLSSQASKNAHRGGSGTGAAPSTASKAHLFAAGATARNLSSGRVIGKPKETERTRELDNEQVLQYQRQIIEEQDADVTDLRQVVARLKDMGIMINEELGTQNDLLKLMEEDVERVNGKLVVAKKRTDKIR